MEFNENLPIDPVPEFEPAADPVIEEEAPQAEPVTAPVAEEEPVLTEDTGWHGVGVGQREEVFAEPRPEPVFEPAYERTYTPQPEEYTVPRRREKKTGGSGKKVQTTKNVVIATISTLNMKKKTAKRTSGSVAFLDFWERF
jgi:hypothetical protein